MALDKAVLIAGGNSGLGRTLVEHFSAKGYRTFSLGLGEFSGHLAGHLHIEADLTSEAQVQSALSRIDVPLDGVILSQRFRGKSDVFNGELQTTVAGSHRLIEALRPRLQQKYCSLILVGSVLSDFVSLEMDVSYHVSKAALAQMARYYAVALRDQAMVNCLQLGTFAKPETERFFEADQDFFRDLTPQGKLMHARDVAGVFYFLVDEKPRYLTGQSIIVDGGITSQWIESYGKARLR